MPTLLDTFIGGDNVVENAHTTVDNKLHNVNTTSSASNEHIVHVNPQHNLHDQFQTDGLPYPKSMINTKFRKALGATIVTSEHTYNNDDTK